MMAGSLNRLNRKGRIASRLSGPPRLNRTTASFFMGNPVAAGIVKPGECVSLRQEPAFLMCSTNNATFSGGVSGVMP